VAARWVTEPAPVGCVARSLVSAAQHPRTAAKLSKLRPVVVLAVAVIEAMGFVPMVDAAHPLDTVEKAQHFARYHILKLRVVPAVVVHVVMAFVPAANAALRQVSVGQRPKIATHLHCAAQRHLPVGTVTF